MYFDSSVHFNVTRTTNKNFIFEPEGPFKATVCKAQHWDTQKEKERHTRTVKIFRYTPQINEHEKVVLAE